jgi:hypothetical protein
MAYGLDDREIRETFRNLGERDNKNSGHVVALAAIVALLPGTGQISIDDAKGLIADLLRGSSGVAEIRREAERFAETILAGASAVSTRRGQTPSQVGDAQAPEASSLGGTSPTQS